MLFSTKRNNAPHGSSTMEACMSILGLVLAMGIVGGVSVLIYGLVKGKVSGTIGGAVVLGVSVVLSVILALIFICCLKNNNVDSNENDQPTSSTNQRDYKQNRHYERNPPLAPTRDIALVSGVYKSNKNNYYYQHQQSVESNPNRYISPAQSTGLTDSTNYGSGKQMAQSPSKISSFTFLNQSNSSMNNQSSLNTSTRMMNYNRP